MNSRNHFRTTHATPSGGRAGLIIASTGRGEEMCLETPAVVPIVVLVGGPPGPERNGGLWRPIKWWLFLQQQVPAFQCNIVHLLSTHQAAPEWSGWRTKPFGQWITDWQRQTAYEIPNSKRPDNGYPFRTIMNWWPFWRQSPGQSSRRPLLFGESGGHALSSEAQRVKFEEEFETVTTSAWALDTQLEMGADVVMSFDHPLRGRLEPEEIYSLQSSSIQNGLDLLAQLANRDTAAMPFIAVHGVNGADAEAYINRFMEGWRQLSPEAQAIPFGIAVGSLSAKASQPDKLIDIMRGVRAGLRKAAPELGGMPPVHVLGVSSRIMAPLVYLGVDTFSSHSYSTAAQGGEYLDSHFQLANVTELDEAMLAECGCFICSTLLERKFLPTMKAELAATKKFGGEPEPEPGAAPKPKGLDRYYRQTETGEWYTRSDLFALLSIHNWVMVTREIARIRAAVRQDCLPEYIWALAGEGRPAFRRAVQNLADADAAEGDCRLKEACGKPSPVSPLVPVPEQLATTQKGLPSRQLSLWEL